MDQTNKKKVEKKKFLIPPVLLSCYPFFLVHATSTSRMSSLCRAWNMPRECHRYLSFSSSLLSFFRFVPFSFSHAGSFVFYALEFGCSLSLSLSLYLAFCMPSVDKLSNLCIISHAFFTHVSSWFLLFLWLTLVPPTFARLFHSLTLCLFFSLPPHNPLSLTL